LDFRADRFGFAARLRPLAAPPGKGVARDERRKRPLPAPSFTDMSQIVQRVGGMSLSGTQMLSRCLDKILGGLVVVLLLPLLILISGLLLLSTRGPVLVHEPRLGLNRQPFSLLKFAVFRQAARAAADPAEEAAEMPSMPRFTRLGWLLRKTRLEDLPQFVNLLIGDITLIGPSPDRKYLEALYADQISEYHKRFIVRPGMTGLAQVKGCRDNGQEPWMPSVETIRQRTAYDLEYVKNRSLWLDTRIMLRTMLCLLLLRPLGEEGKIQKVGRMFGRLTTVANRLEHEKLLARLDDCNTPTILSFLNAHGFNVAWSDKRFQQAMAQSDFILRDGVGMKLALQMFQRSPGCNMNGTDFIPRIIERQKNRRVAVLGTKDPWLGKAVEELKAKDINVVWSDHGFHPIEYYAEQADQYAPQLIILAMGMPKQEYLAEVLKARLNTPCLIVNGGAVIDFLGKRVERAPKLVRRMGLEWAHRLCLEPRRLFFRYVLGNPLFLYRVLLMRLRQGFVGFRSSMLGTLESSNSPRAENI